MFDQLFTSLVANTSGEFSADLCTIMLSALVASLSSIFDAFVHQGTLFFVQGACSSDSCPGSFYLPITAAWANIGYMTHGDFVHFVWNTSFGLWAALFYAVGAAGALIAVSINQPPKTYMWFFLGPAIYSFLVGTPTTVQGVAWRIANKNMDMEEVWRDAETGMANTALVRDLGLQTSRRNGPSGTYQVAWPMVFLDGLFSEATNNLVSWIGMQRREGRGGADSNLFNRETEEGPWQLLANLKWGMVENIVGVSARDPDVRDALVTFLTSECGDQFKKGVNSGAYSAAAQSRGANLPKTVFIGTDPTTEGLNDQVASVGGNSYANFVRGLDTEAIPTPRSMIRLFNSPAITGSFREFSQQFSGTQAYDSGRLTDIVCSEYLYMIVQAMRWEAGHSYHQLLRSFPNGFETEQAALKTLFYGWNLRPEEEASLIEGEELKKYTKHLILVHMIRNELMFAPQVTEQGQRFSPSEQARNHTEDYVRQQGSRSKYGELYQWAVMMPHVQGILAYLVLIGYPFAAMLMVVPGYWKVFFTWISFFAWVKLWDVGFAIVHTLERSVWAMIGNHSSMARVGRRLIQTAQAASSDVQVTCSGGGGGGGAGGITGGGQKLSQLCSVPTVKEAGSFDEEKAWFLFDQAMLLSGSLDLDLSNGYYIYIMAALYFAVPAVTGQLVLGAKSGLGNIATQAIGQNAQEAGGAAKAGTVGDNTNKLASNRAAIDQGARAQSFRKSGLAQQTLDAQNAAMDADIRGAEIGVHQRAFGATADARRDNQESMGSHGAFTTASGQLLGRTLGAGKPQAVRVVGGGKSLAGPSLASDSASAASPGGLASAGSGYSPEESASSAPPTASPPAGAGGDNSPFLSPAEAGKTMMLGLGGLAAMATPAGRAKLFSALSGAPAWGAAGLNNHFGQQYFAARAHNNALGLDFGMQKARADLAKSGFQAYSQSLGAEADYEASSAAYDALAANASHLAPKAGVTGANPGGLVGSKPGAMRELATGGMLGGEAKKAGYYSGFGYMSGFDSMLASNRSTKGSGLYGNHLQLFSYNEALGASFGTAGRQFMQMKDMVENPSSSMKEFNSGIQKSQGAHGFSGLDQVSQAMQQQLPVPENSDASDTK